VINGTPAGNRSTGDDSAVKKYITETHGLSRTTGAFQGCRDNDFLYSGAAGSCLPPRPRGSEHRRPDPGQWRLDQGSVEELGAPGVPALAKIAGDDAITPAILDAYIARRVKALTAANRAR